MFNDLITRTKEEMEETEQNTGTVSTSGAKSAAKLSKISVKKLQKEHEKEMNKKADEAGNAGNAGSCLWLCSQTQSLRAVCTVVVRNQWFERLIIVGIVYSSLSLAIDAPLLPEESELKKWLVVSNYTLSAVFITEAALKIISEGLVQYLSLSWNRLDLLIVLVSVVDVVAGLVMTDSSGVAPLKTFRILRALRPIRIIARADGAEGVRLLMSAMYNSLRPITATISIACMLYAFLGLVGMQFLLGKLGTCSDAKIKFMRDCWGADEAGVARVWVHPVFNFDVLPAAVVSVFKICSLDNYPDMLWASADGRGRVVQVYIA